MLPVIVPIVQVKVLATEAVNVMFGLTLLQALAVAAFVTTGLGTTDTVNMKGEPAQAPVEEVGVTKYCTVPVVVVLELVRT
jgi:hypothetical protein